MVLSTLLKDLGIAAVPYGFRPSLLSLGDLPDLGLGAVRPWVESVMPHKRDLSIIFPTEV